MQMSVCFFTSNRNLISAGGAKVVNCIMLKCITLPVLINFDTTELRYVQKSVAKHSTISAVSNLNNSD
jgi:hypothetical protein